MCMSKRRPSSVGDAVLTTTTTVIYQQAAEMMMFWMVKDTPSHVVIRQDVIVTADHRRIGCDELKAPVARFDTKTVDEATWKVWNVYKFEVKVAEELPSPSSLETSDCKSFRSKTWSRQKQCTRKKAEKSRRCM